MANVQTVSERNESYRGDVHVLQKNAVRRNKRQIIDSFGQGSIQFGIVLLQITLQDDQHSSIIDFLAILRQVQQLGQCIAERVAELRILLGDDRQLPSTNMFETNEIIQLRQSGQHAEISENLKVIFIANYFSNEIQSDGKQRWMFSRQSVQNHVKDSIERSYQFTMILEKRNPLLHRRMFDGTNFDRNQTMFNDASGSDANGNGSPLEQCPQMFETMIVDDQSRIRTSNAERQRRRSHSADC